MTQRVLKRAAWAGGLVFALGVALTACGSSVKLDDAPVEDRSGQAVVASGAASDATVAANSQASVARNVQSVQVESGSDPAGGPKGAARLVFFDYDSFVIKPEYQAVVEQHARYLSQNKAKRISIEGHTDERGGREYNLALGQKRAEAVQQALRLLGVGTEQMEPVSFGKEKPTASGGSEQSLALNRRAELRYK